MALTEKLSLVIDSVGFGRAGSDFRKLSNDIDKAGKSSASTADYMRALGPVAVVAGGAVAAGMGVAVAATLNFDRTMSKVGAVAEASAEDMKKLRDAAIDAGRATVFSAADAAQAEAELAKAGVSAADILGGALRGSLDLAAAGQLDLAQAAEISAQAMNVFGLKGQDVSHIADVLAAGANKSAADIDDLGLALQQSALVADQMGLSLEETVGILAMFAQNGLRGSDAGTSFKRSLQTLTPTSDRAKEKMKELGIEVFDASGKFVGIQKAAQELQEGLSNLSDEERQAALNVIFGSDAIRAATLLYKSGASGVAEWTKKVNDSGFASRVAAKQLDNLAGDLENLRGSIETALIEGGSKATTALRFLAQDATTAVNVFSGLPSPVQTAGVAISGIGSAALIAVGAIGIMLPKLRTTQEALSAMGPAGVSAAKGLGLLAKGSAVAVGVVALAEGVHFLAVELDKMIRGAPQISELTGALADLASQADAPIAPVFEFSRGDLGDIPELLDNIDAADRRLSQGAKSGLKNKLDDIDKALSGLVQSGAPEAAKQALDRLAGTLDVSPKALLIGLDDYSKALRETEAAAKVADTASTEAAGGISKAGGAAGESSGAMSDFGEETEELADAADKAEKKLKRFKDSMDALIGVHVSAIQAESDYQAALDEVGDAFADKSDRIEDLQKKLASGKKLTDEERTSIQEEIRTLTQEAAARLKSARALDLNTEAGRKAQDSLDGLVESGLKRIENLAREGASMERLGQVFDQNVADLRRQGKEVGLTDAQIEAYIQRVGLIPPNKTTIIAQLGAEGAAAAIGTIKTSADNAAAAVRDNLNPALQTTYDKLIALGGLFALIAKVAAGGSGTAGTKTPGLSGLEGIISGKKAKGGDVGPNGLYLVGEEGPELLKMGANGGYVYSNDVYEKMRGSLSVEARAAGGYVGRPRLYGEGGPIIGGKSETQNIMPNANIVIQPPNFDAFVRDTERQARLAALAGI